LTLRFQGEQISHQKRTIAREISLHDQIVELKAAGASRAFAEKLSVAHSDRPMLRKALAALDEGDTLMVVRLDRLARSTRDLLNILHEAPMSASSARQQGIRFGRPPKLTMHQQTEALRLLDEGEPQAAVARLLGVDQSTISRLAARVAA
jgi:DNA invertase Pin-like site-specific DNA recombinase